MFTYIFYAMIGLKGVGTMAGTSATRAKNKYQAANYDRINLVVPKGQKEIIRAAAESAGSASLNEFVLKAIEEKMERDQKEN